jgi:hypothetical protein
VASVLEVDNVAKQARQCPVRGDALKMVGGASVVHPSVTHAGSGAADGIGGRDGGKYRIAGRDRGMLAGFLGKRHLGDL